MLGLPSAVTYVNGRIVTPQGEARSIRVRKRILAIDQPPQPGDQVVDLDGRFVLPGLINAHDHLELNHYGALKGRERYGNAREWIDDLRPVIRDSVEIRDKSRINLADRLFIGGLKNLLAGVTTVAHHNPMYRAFGLHFPVHLVTRFGWAHSLGMEQGPVGAHGEPGGVVADAAAATPVDRSFIVHAAEGVDACAGSEVDALEASGVLRGNTVLVHGLAVSPERWHALFARGVGLVWCPASNLFLFGRTLCMPCVLASPGAAGRVCLGSDSRVTGSNDLLEELRVAADAHVAPDLLLRMVTTWAAQLLRLDDAGRLRVGAAADLLVIPALADAPAEALLRCHRSDVALVVRRGTPMVGEPALRTAFDARRIHVRAIEVDGRVRVAQAALARRIERCLIREPGVNTSGCA
ncbi:MAG: amidohydrolase family protein [Vicinamibacterales bacterium]